LPSPACRLQLPAYTLHLLAVSYRFHGEKKEELLGVAANRVMRMNLQTGDHIKTWRYSTMKVSLPVLFS
jgi:kindlin 2